MPELSREDMIRMLQENPEGLSISFEDEDNDTDSSGFPDEQYDSADFFVNRYLFSNILSINKGNISDSCIDRDLFVKGVKSVSELCGAITALVNIGVHPNKAMDYLAEKEFAIDNRAHNLELTKIQAETGIAISKNENGNMQKNTI